MGPMNILPSKSELTILLCIVGFIGWTIIELILWLLSFVTITITG